MQHMIQLRIKSHQLTSYALA